MTITSINPGDKLWTHKTWILSFGAYGTMHLYVHANSLEDAFDECVDWLADNAPELLCDEQVTEAYNEAIAAGKSEEEAMDEATVDTSCGGNNGHYVLSWEWSCLAEDPTFSDLREMVTR